MERALSPKLGSVRPGARFLRDLVGVPAYERGMREHISGIRVRGDTISFTLTAPSPDFLERISLSFFSPVPPGTPAITGGVSAEAALASPGPYYIADRVNGEWAILKRNPNYRGPRRGALDALALREGLDPEQAVSRVQRGEFDGLLLDDALLRPGGAVAHRFAGEQSSGAVTYRAFPTRTVRYLALNAGAGPLRDAALRQAVAAAIDRRALAVVQGATPTDGLLPPEPASVGDTGDRAPAVGVDPAGRAALDGGAAWLRPLPAVRRHRGLGPGRARRQRRRGRGREPAGRHSSQSREVRPSRPQHQRPAPGSGRVPRADAGHDVPRGWLPTSTQAAIARLDTLSVRRREEAAPGSPNISSGPMFR